MPWALRYAVKHPAARDAITLRGELDVRAVARPGSLQRRRADATAGPTGTQRERRDGEDRHRVEYAVQASQGQMPARRYENRHPIAVQSLPSGDTAGNACACCAH